MEIIPTTPYKFDEKDLVEHIEHVCQTIGEYEGKHIKIYRTGMERLSWGILHHSEVHGSSSELYTTLDEAISDFIALSKVYE